MPKRPITQSPLWNTAVYQIRLYLGESQGWQVVDVVYNADDAHAGFEAGRRNYSNPIDLIHVIPGEVGMRVLGADLRYPGGIPEWEMRHEKAKA